MKPFTSLITKSLFVSLLLLILVSVKAQRPGSYSSLYFDGINDNCLISDDTSLNPKNEITVEAWIRADSFGKNVYDNSVFCKHGWSSGNQGYVLRCGAGGNVSFNVSGRASGGKWEEANTTTAVIKTGYWYHLAGTFDGDSVNVYVNGELVVSHLYSGQIQISSGLDPKIGELSFGTGRNFMGEIDEVRVWNKALSSAELKKYMCQKINKSHPKYANLVGYWNLDENSSTKIADRSSFGNDGVLKDGPTWQISKVPLGDTAVYASNPSVLSLKSAQGDVFSYHSTFGSPGTVFLYMTNDTTENSAAPGVGVRLDSTHYYGVYTTNPGATFAVGLDYGKHPVNGTNSECGVDLLTKETGGGGTWNSASAKIFAPQDSMVLGKTTSAEFMLGIYSLDSNSVLSTETGKPWLCSNDSLQLIAQGNKSFTYKWYRNDTLQTNIKSNTWFIKKAGKYQVSIQRDTTCGVSSVVMNVTVKKAPKVTLPSIKGVCEDTDTVKLKLGSPKGGKFLFKGIINDSIVLPSKLGPGAYDIVYQFTDTNTCAGTDTQTLNVWALPNTFFSYRLSLCSNVDTLDLVSAKPSGGIYTGTGIVNNQLIPARFNRNTGKYPYTYSVTDKNGCYNEASDTFEIKRTDRTSIIPRKSACIKDDPFKLVGIPAGGIFTGDNVSAGRFDPSVSGAGTKTVYYSYTNTLGCTDRDTQKIEVYNNTPVSWNYTLTSCLNGDSILPKEGSPSGGSFSGTGIRNNYFHPSLAGSGKHQITYLFVDSNGCRNTAMTSAEVKDTTTLTLGTIPSVCVNAFLKLGYVQPGGGSYSGDGVSGDTMYGNKAGEGAHTVRYAYTNNGCTSVSDEEIQVLGLPVVSMELPTSICANESPVKIKLQPVGGNLSGKGIISDLFSPSFAGIGKHVINYSYTDSNGCTNTVNNDIEVGAVPNVKTVSYESICSNELPYELQGGISPKVVAYYYRLNGEMMDTVPVNTVSGEYDIDFVAYTPLGCRDSAQYKFRINPIPTKPNVTIQGNKLVSSHLKGNQWYNTSGAINGETGREYFPDVSGDYYVVVTSDSGCVNKSDAVTFEHVGISEVSRNSVIRVFPNPGTGVYSIESNTQKVMDVDVIDFNGQVVLSIRETDVKLIDLSDFADGVYLFQMSAGGSSVVQRVVKR